MAIKRSGLINSKWIEEGGIKVYQDNYTPDDELYHYGRKGMKWGQHIFGKVKSGASSIKRRAGNAIATKKEKRLIKKLHKKPISRMTESEIKEYVKRMNLEKTASLIKRDVAGLSKDNVSAGKSFTSKIRDDVIVPSLVSAGKKVLSEALEKKFGTAFGLDKKSAYDTLKAEVDELDLKVKKKENERKLKNDGSDQDESLAKQAKTAEHYKKIYDSENARLTYEKNLANANVSNLPKENKVVGKEWLNEMYDL